MDIEMMKTPAMEKYLGELEEISSDDEEEGKVEVIKEESEGEKVL